MCCLLLVVVRRLLLLARCALFVVCWVVFVVLLFGCLFVVSMALFAVYGLLSAW